MNDVSQDSPKPAKCSNYLRNAIVVALFVFGIGILALVAVKMIVSNSFCNNKKNVEGMAINAVRARLYNPEDFKVTAISELDSVFANRYCPDYETIELSQKYLDYTLSLMDSSSQSRSLEDMENMCDYRKFSKASEAIDLFNELLAKPQGDFCGWRLKLRYSCLDKNNNPTESEMWLIFDADKKFIYETFEFPIL